MLRMAFALVLLAASAARAEPQGDPAGTQRTTGGRFTFVAMPSDAALAKNLLAVAIAADSFPGLPRPRRPATIMIAPNAAAFREWIGGGVPEWGIAVAIPEEHRIVMQGRSADSRAGDPRVSLRHELAHLALHEYLTNLPPRWFDEGYASYSAGEWGRDEVLSSSVVLALRGVPHFGGLDTLIAGGTARAEQGYALAHRAVADVAAIDPRGGLTLLFRYWHDTRKLDAAFRQAYGITLDGFENTWRQATRRRYGALAMLGDVGFASLVLFLIVGPFWLVRRRRDRTRLDAMRAADKLADRRERESALAALLGKGGDMDESEDQIKGR